MTSLLAAACSVLELDPTGLARLTERERAEAIAEHRTLSDQLAGQHGCLHRSFSGDGDIFLFQTADAALRFALLLIDRAADLGGIQGRSRAVRFGVHHGTCLRIEADGEWIGEAITVARRLAEVAAPAAVLVGESLLDRLDLSLYGYEQAGSYALRNDRLPSRTVYRVSAFVGRTAERTIPQTPESWFLRGASMAGTLLENSRAEADCYREALLLRQDYAEAHTNLGIVLRAMGDATGAEYHYREALELRPHYPEASLNLAILLTARDELAGARRAFEDCLRLKADMPAAHHGLANLLRREGALGDAAEHFCTAIELRPGSAEIRNDYALLLQDRGDDAGARVQFEEALARHPESAETRYNLAFLLENQGDIAGAEEHYRVAIGSRPGFAEAHNNLATLLHTSGRLDEAEQHYLATLNLRPKDPQAHHNYALLLSQCAERASPGGQPGALVVSRGAPPAATIAPLTRREVEVLRMVAGGHSNREIADRLVLSVNTVERHVANIYLKIGARGRADATAFAIRQGVVALHDSR
jgi:Flp pilus assembly protein TadD/DNA-binding CsgD family transcriptional regulator